MKNRIQQPSNGFDWLYKDEEEIRLFAKEVSLPNNVSDWAECTNEEKVQWEKEHTTQAPDTAEEGAGV
jgi:hypothetical protein